MVSQETTNTKFTPILEIKITTLPIRHVNSNSSHNANFPID